jgi:mycothiol synthase
MSSLVLKDEVTLTDAPAVPGLVFRRFRGDPDFANIVSIIAASAKADNVERVDSVEIVAQNYANLKGCDPTTDMVFAEVEGEAIGYARGWWEHEVKGDYSYRNFGFLKPDWRRKGIGTTLLKWVEARQAVIAREHEHAQSPHYQAFYNEEAIGTKALLLANGYKPVTYQATMVRPDLANIPDIHLPEGIEVRPVTGEHVRPIFEASREAFKDHWGDSEMTEEDFNMIQWEFEHYDPSLWRIAWEGDQIVAMVRSFINEEENKEYNRKRGWTENICTRKAWRRKGIAKALIAMSLQAIKERGMESAALGVHVENPNGAYQLYESMGFQVVRTDTIVRKALEL